MNKSESIANLSAALAGAQAEMPVAVFDASNPFLKNRYASLGAVIHASRAALAKHKLSLIQFPISGENTIGVESILAHASGEFISERILIPVTEEKGKSKAQAAGSALTYIRRYSWSSILGMYSDADTDGAEPQSKPETAPEARATTEQVIAINMLVDNLKIDNAQIQKWFAKEQAASFKEFSASAAARLITALESKLKK